MNSAHNLFCTVLLLCGVSVPQDPPAEQVTIGLIRTDSSETGYAAQMEQAARLTADHRNAKGGIDGSEIVIAVENCQPTRKAISAAVANLITAGALGVIAPLESDLANLTRRAARGKLPCVSYDAQNESIQTTLVQHVMDSYRCTEIAYVHDKSREAKAIVKWMKKAMPPPCHLALEFDFGIKPKDLKKKLEKVSPQVLVVDGTAAAVAEFLSTTWAEERLPTLLTPRCFGPELVASGREYLVLHGRSPRTMESSGWFFDEYRQKHKDLRFGAAEGFEAMTLLIRAIDAADSHDLVQITKALKGGGAEGARGKVSFDTKRFSIDPPLALWRLDEGQMHPYLPSVIPDELRGKGTSGGKQPDTDFGEPIGHRRTHQFEFEPDTVWVLFGWRGKLRGTIDADLTKLGLSTDGDNLLLDQLVKDELMARVLSITSTKYLRNPDGTSIPGKSLKISFATRLPDKRHKLKKPKTLWRAFFAGDDTAAGGRAFGTYCEIYTIFIRRTIFQEHELKPGLTDSDLAYLNGTYRFGTNQRKDKRSELIRALINGYAGAMALTAAHELGHLCGLGHVTNPPTAIMNVAEGGGIDYRDGSFCGSSIRILVKRLGITDAKQK